MRMEQSIDISKYSYLWTSELSDHVLLKRGRERNGVPDVLIYDKLHERALIIEDDAKSQAVKEQMLKHGCQIVDKLT